MPHDVSIPGWPDEVTQPLRSLKARTLPRFLYEWMTLRMYNRAMDVAISELRAHLSEWLERAHAGSEIVITERGIPVARLLGLTTTTTLERLTSEGVIGRPAAAQRPRASGRARPHSHRPLAEIVSDQRG
jgi:prevent-host-death family protein